MHLVVKNCRYLEMVLCVLLAALLIFLISFYLSGRYTDLSPHWALHVFFTAIGLEIFYLKFAPLVMIFLIGYALQHVFIRVLKNPPVIDARDESFWSIVTGKERLPYKDIKKFELVEEKKITSLRIVLRENHALLSNDVKVHPIRRASNFIDKTFFKKYMKEPFTINLNPTNRYPEDVLKYLEKNRKNAKP